MATKQPTTEPQPSLNGHKPEKAPYDPFNTSELRDDSLGDIKVEKVLTAVPVRRPKRNEFVRVHPEFVCDRLLVERDTGMEKECYLVTPEVEELGACLTNGWPTR